MPDRLVERACDGRGVLVAARHVRDIAGSQIALDEIIEPVPVALLERRSLRLPVVGEHDQLVGARRVPASSLDATERDVELAQRLECVGALEARVMCDLVVTRERGVHDWAALHHVLQDAEDDQVAHDHAERAAHQWVDAATMATRDDLAAPLPTSGHEFKTDLPEEQDQRLRGVGDAGEERAVARVGLRLGVHATDGQDAVVGTTRQQVAAARPAIAQEPALGGVPALDLGTIGGR